MGELRRYGEATGLPVLLACRWTRPFGRDFPFQLWTLNDLSTFRLAQTSFHLDFEAALRESLLGVLAGDFCVQLKPGVGVHFEHRKVRRVSHGDGKEEWQTVVSSVYFTNGRGQRLPRLHQGMWEMLLQFSLREQVHSDEQTILVSHTVPDEPEAPEMMWAQHVLPLFLSSGKIRWRQVLERKRFQFGPNTVRQAMERGLQEDCVHLILDVHPHIYPVWLKWAASPVADDEVSGSLTAGVVRDAAQRPRSASSSRGVSSFQGGPFNPDICASAPRQDGP